MVDLILVGIIVVSAVLAGSRGLVKTIAGMFGTLISYFATAKLVVPYFAPKIAVWITPYCTKMLMGSAERSGVLASATQSGAMDNITELLDKLHIPLSFLDPITQKVADFGNSVLAATAEVMGSELAPLIAFVAGFIAIKFAINLAAKLLSINLPIIGTLNHGAGCLLGAASGALLAVVLCVGLRAFAPQGIAGFLSLEQINSSLIGGFIFKFLG